MPEIRIESSCAACSIKTRRRGEISFKADGDISISIRMARGNRSGRQRAVHCVKLYRLSLLSFQRDLCLRDEHEFLSLRKYSPVASSRHTLLAGDSLGWQEDVNGKSRGMIWAGSPVLVWVEARFI